MVILGVRPRPPIAPRDGDGLPTPTTMVGGNTARLPSFVVVDVVALDADRVENVATVVDSIPSAPRALVRRRCARLSWSKTRYWYRCATGSTRRHNARLG